jgi:Phage head-tail joining protein
VSLSPAVIASLRARQNAFLPDRAAIQRYVTVESGDGGQAVWSDVLTDVPCRVSPLASGVSEAIGAAAGIAAVSQWTIWLVAETDVTERDRIVVGARTFEAQRVGARSYETVREVICQLLS